MGNLMGAVAAALLSDCRVVGAADRHEDTPRSERLEAMMLELFHLHDLNGNGRLEEVELVKLNEKIAILHQGRDADRELVRERYRGIFRAELDARGEPVQYWRFREYMFRMLDRLDPDEPTQAMILDQFIAEADLALSAFPGSLKVRSGVLASLAQRSPRLSAAEVARRQSAVSPLARRAPHALAAHAVSPHRATPPRTPHAATPPRTLPRAALAQQARPLVAPHLPRQPAPPPPWLAAQPPKQPAPLGARGASRGARAGGA